MKSIEKQKICPSCEARIPLEIETCPFCAHEMHAQSLKSQNQIFQSQSLEDSLASLYKPPYQGKRHLTEESLSTPLNPQSVEASLYGQTASEEEPKEKQSSLLPTLLLLIASNLFILGLMQLFFSTNGVVRLEFDASNWFFYCILSAPLFYFGWKKLQNIE